jgi:putative NADH-flavin reductase
MMASKLLVLGPTGGTGRSVVEQALAAGHRVTVLARDPGALPVNARAARVVQGDLVKSSAALDAAMPSQDAVISALGTGKSLQSGNLITRAAPRIVDAMRRHGVRRLVFTSAFGIGATRRDTPRLPRLFIATLLRDIYADKERGEQAILASDLDWTIVYPVGLTDGPRTGRYRVGEHLALHGFPTIPRADVAEFLLRQLEDRSFLRKGVLIAS